VHTLPLSTVPAGVAAGVAAGVPAGFVTVVLGALCRGEERQREKGRKEWRLLQLLSNAFVLNMVLASRCLLFHSSIVALRATG
jgi:hypothetical protein